MKNFTFQINKHRINKFTKQAQDTLKQQVEKLIGKICEEAERIEANRCSGDISKVQITPHTVERAVDYVVEERIERRRPHWFPAIVCPICDTLAGISFSYSIEHFEQYAWLAFISIVILAFALITPVFYFYFKK